ncbi:MAG: hypothetical protein V1729_00530 [Candidatus Woesearchaeota archaeon]
MRDVTRNDAPNYAPRNALIVMSETDKPYVSQLARSLMAQGIRFSYRSDKEEALNYLQSHNVDVLITGNGYDAIANYVETHNEDHGTFTIAVSNNGVRADVKLQSTTDLGTYIQEGLVRQDYMHNSDAQACRRDFEELSKGIESLLN